MEAALAFKVEVLVAASSEGPAAVNGALFVASSILNAKKAWEASDEFRRGDYYMFSIKFGQALAGEFIAIAGTASLGLVPLSADVAKLVAAIATHYVYSYANYQK